MRHEHRDHRPGRRAVAARDVDALKVHGRGDTEVRALIDVVGLRAVAAQ